MALSRKHVARLMRLTGLAGVSRRKSFKTTIRDRIARPAPDLVERCFTANTPDRLWVADITYISTLSGFLFLAVVLDALDMALWQRRPKAVTITLIKESSTPRAASGCAVSRLVCGLLWVRSVTASITPCARASLGRWNESCSTVPCSRLRPRRVRWCLSSSRTGITHIADTHRLTTNHPSIMEGDCTSLFSPKL